MTRLRVIVVEDQAPAREHLVDLVSRHPDVEVVAVCADGRAALDAIGRTPADVVLLDIQMPELDGFQVIERAGAAMPPVVFITAYDDHAVRAFDVRALDYLVKPFTRARVDRALDLARASVRQRRLTAAAGALATLVRPDASPATPTAERLKVRQHDRVLFIDAADVLWAEARRNEVVLHAAAAQYRCRATLAAMQRTLGVSFVRAHRSALVNLDAVERLLLVDGGAARVRLTTGGEVPVSRACRPEVERRLAGRAE